MPISLPMTLRRCTEVKLSKSISPSRKRSARTRQFSLVMPIIAFATRLFPEPDSPTSPRISPSLKVRLNLSTAFKVPCGVMISMVRFRISSSAINQFLQSQIVLNFRQRY